MDDLSREHHFCQYRTDATAPELKAHCTRYWGCSNACVSQESKERLTRYFSSFYNREMWQEGSRAYVELVEEGVDGEHHDEVHDHADDEEGQALQATADCQSLGTTSAALGMSELVSVVQPVALDMLLPLIYSNSAA